jgi:hypothetical protein
MDGSEIERELEELEIRGERLRALYEQYFMGLEKIEPQVQRKDLERRVQILRKEQIRNTGLRFKFQMLVQRYNTMQQYWSRITREIENGTYRRDVVKAALKIGTKEALTIVGKKRAGQLERLVAAQVERLGRRTASGGRLADDYEEVADVDVIVEDDEHDEVPTPPRHSLPPAPQAYVLPDHGYDPRTHGYSDATPAPHSSPSYGTPPPYGDPAPPSRPSAGGLRLGQRAHTGTFDATPSGIRSAPDPQRPSPEEAARRRVAELAAEVRVQRAPSATQSFGSLDLDFESSAPPPPRRDLAPAAPAKRGFGEIEIGSEPPPPPPRPAPSPPVSSAGRTPSTGQVGQVGPRQSTLMGQPPQPVAQPPAPAPSIAVPPAVAAPQVARPAATLGPRQPTAPFAYRPAPARPVETNESLPDQKLRQIYAKYVETKRAANESTAGVTFDKLAASLRAQEEKLRKAHPNRTVDYDVVLKDGKATIKPVLK